MRLPLVIEKDLSARLRENYRVRFARSSDYDRSVRENVWRRHQDMVNQKESGWTPGAARRRIVFYRDRYDIVDNNFCLVETYLFFNIKAPQADIDNYKKAISAANLGDLKLEVVESNVCQSGYSNLDFRIYSHTYTQEMVERPWHIFSKGIRAVKPKGNPQLIDDLDAFYPAQVELGCGPSIEADIPPLNYFHNLFSLHKDGRFIFNAEDDRLLFLFQTPQLWYEKAAYMHKQCLKAEPTVFYYRMKKLFEEGKLVGPILNNNFDGLPLSVGLSEIPLRKYDINAEYPPIEFHPAAKSLFVIGCHADRRKCQEHAHNAGLKVVYIDPEGYEIDGSFIPYPLEAPQTGDYIFNAKSSQVFA